MISILHWNHLWLYTFENVGDKVLKNMNWSYAYSWTPILECRTKGEVRKWIIKNFPEESFKFIMFYHDKCQSKHNEHPLPSRPKKKFKRRDLF